MTAILWIIATILLATLANYIRGGNLDRVTDDATGKTVGYFPFRGLYLAVPLMGVAAWFLWPWQVAVAWAIGFLIFAFLPWGHLRGYAWGYMPTRSEHPISQWLVKTFGRGFVALTALYWLGTAATIALVAATLYLIGTALTITNVAVFIASSFFFAAALALCDRLTALRRDGKEWSRAEAMHGVVWGVAIAAWAVSYSFL